MHNKLNDGSGTPLVISQLGDPLSRVVVDGVTFVRFAHPLPVLSARVFSATKNVIDSTVGWTNVAVEEDDPWCKEYYFLYEGREYRPGTALEDGMRMPCLWVYS